MQGISNEIYGSRSSGQLDRQLSGRLLYGLSPGLPYSDRNLASTTQGQTNTLSDGPLSKNFSVEDILDLTLEDSDSAEETVLPQASTSRLEPPVPQPVLNGLQANVSDGSAPKLFLDDVASPARDLQFPSAKVLGKRTARDSHDTSGCTSASSENEEAQSACHLFPSDSKPSSTTSVESETRPSLKVKLVRKGPPPLRDLRWRQPPDPPPLPPEPIRHYWLFAPAIRPAPEVQLRSRLRTPSPSLRTPQSSQGSPSKLAPSRRQAQNVILDSEDEREALESAKKQRIALRQDNEGDSDEEDSFWDHLYFSAGEKPHLAVADISHDGKDGYVASAHPRNAVVAPLGKDKDRFKNRKAQVLPFCVNLHALPSAHRFPRPVPAEEVDWGALPTTIGFEPLKKRVFAKASISSRGHDS